LDVGNKILLDELMFKHVDDFFDMHGSLWKDVFF